MDKNDILIVDDEKEIADLLEVYLTNENYHIHKFYSALAALECVENAPISLAILDVMMPEMDGFSLCQKIREKHFFPIIMLTAKTDDMSKIQGLSLGADDYITKPFNPLEVVARVKTQLRRYKHYNTNAILFSHSLNCTLCAVVLEFFDSSAGTNRAGQNNNSNYETG